MFNRSVNELVEFTTQSGRLTGRIASQALLLTGCGLFAEAAFDPGCVKTREKSSNKKIDFSERPLRDFRKVGGGYPTHEIFKFWRFYTAFTHCGRSWEP